MLSYGRHLGRTYDLIQATFLFMKKPLAIHSSQILAGTDPNNQLFESFIHIILSPDPLCSTMSSNIF